jgi:CRP/FNR family transcriptional regulator, cyclic AMP receptor protein
MSTTIGIFQHASDALHFRAGDLIFAAGEPGDVMYVVQQGTVEICHRDTLILAHIGPGEVVGEMALIDQGPRSATAIAASDCTLVPLDERQFTYLVQEHPYFALRVMRVLVERLRQSMEQPSDSL